MPSCSTGNPVPLPGFHSGKKSCGQVLKGPTSDCMDGMINIRATCGMRNGKQQIVGCNNLQVSDNSSDYTAGGSAPDASGGGYGFGDAEDGQFIV